MTTIPLSRLKREMNKIMKLLQKGQLDLVYVSRCGKVVFVVVSTNYYEEIKL